MSNSFKPYVAADKKPRELTATSVITGIAMAIVFGGANAYLGLRVGMTVSASIPAAVISMGIIRVILKRDSILENNIVQTIGSAGESLAAGAIFTMPALFMWAKENNESAPSLLEISLIAFCGGVLGIFFMVPLRQALIVKEHGVLPYPEGKACSEVLLAGEKGGAKAKLVFAGMGVSALYKFITDGLRLFPSEVDYQFKRYKGAGIGADILPALAGVGYICGVRVASYLLAGGIMGWLVIMPLMSLFGQDMTLYPGNVPISQMETWDMWSYYIRYIGAGAVAAGGIISLIKSFPMITDTFKNSLFSYRKSEAVNRHNIDIPMNTILIGIFAVIAFMWIVPVIPVNLFGAVIIALFGFFFATVSSRMVGLVGGSNNPVSGMAIATLLIATLLLKSVGRTGMSGMTAAITIGSIICIIASIAGDSSQDLKTGYILGATPIKQQIGELIGIAAASLAIGGILYLLNAAWGYGSTQLPAPQATLMKLVVEGVMEGNLPWTLVVSGMLLAVVVEILGIPVLPFAVGLYLPIHLSLPIVSGGIIRYVIDAKKGVDEEQRRQMLENGTLYSSGLIAGEGLVGIILAVFAVINIGGESIQSIINCSKYLNIGSIGGIILYGMLLLSLLFAATHKYDKT